MRVIIMHRTDPRWERAEVPCKDLIDNVGRMIGKLAQSGKLLGGEGLRASSLGVRLQVNDGNRTLTPGPLTPGNELPAGFTIVRTKTLEEATEWASRLADAIGDAEFDIRPVTETWDIGLAPKPGNVTTTRFMLLHKADATAESGRPRPARVKAKLDRIFEEMKSAGVFLASVGLAPSAQGKRYTYDGGKQKVFDGPFAESKELIAGYVMFEADSFEEAMAFAPEYGAAVECPSMDLRVVE